MHAELGVDGFEVVLHRSSGDPKFGADMKRLHPYVTLMVGRLDDHLQRVMTRDAVSIDQAVAFLATSHEERRRQPR